MTVLCNLEGRVYTELSHLKYSELFEEIISMEKQAIPVACYIPRGTCHEGSTVGWIYSIVRENPSPEHWTQAVDFTEIASVLWSYQKASCDQNAPFQDADFKNTVHWLNILKHEEDDFLWCLPGLFWRSLLSALTFQRLESCHTHDSILPLMILNLMKCESTWAYKSV